MAERDEERDTATAETQLVDEKQAEKDRITGQGPIGEPGSGGSADDPAGNLGRA